MDREKILDIIDKLSQNTLSCVLKYNSKTNFFSGVNINGNNMTLIQIEEYFNKYKVGTDCTIEKIIFQPKNKEFLVTINNGVITCSYYADKEDVDIITNDINKLLR